MRVAWFVLAVYYNLDHQVMIDYFSLSDSEIIIRSRTPLSRNI